MGIHRIALETETHAHEPLHHLRIGFGAGFGAVPADVQNRGGQYKSQRHAWKEVGRVAVQTYGEIDAVDEQFVALTNLVVKPGLFPRRNDLLVQTSRRPSFELVKSLGIPRQENELAQREGCRAVFRELHVSRNCSGVVQCESGWKG